MDFAQCTSNMNGELTNDDVLERQIPWGSYKTTGQISDRDYGLIKRIDKSTDPAKRSAMEEVRSFALK